MRQSFVLYAAMFASIPLHAGLIFDQSPPNLTSLDMTNFRVADNFTVAGAANLAAINFWYQAAFQTDLSSVTYGIYQDSGGSLGTLLYSGTGAPATSADTNAFFAILSVPALALSAGTYWLELHAGSTFTDDNGTITVWWSNADDNGTAVALMNGSGGVPDSTAPGISGFEQMAFQLDSTTASSSTPEPESLLLAGSMVALFVTWSLYSARRKRKDG